MKLHLRGIKKGFATNSSSYHNMITFYGKDEIDLSDKTIKFVLEDSKIIAMKDEELEEKYDRLSVLIGFKNIREYFNEFYSVKEDIFDLIRDSSLSKKAKDDLMLLSYSTTLEPLLEELYNITENKSSLLTNIKELFLESNEDNVYFYEETVEMVIFDSPDDLVKQFYKSSYGECESNKIDINGVNLYTYHVYGHD